jgi:hypothetical protein
MPQISYTISKNRVGSNYNIHTKSKQKTCLSKEQASNQSAGKHGQNNGKK